MSSGDEQEVMAVEEQLKALIENGTIREIEQAVIELRMARLGSVPKAAASLGLSQPTVYGKVRKYGLAATRREAENVRRAARPV